MDIPNFKDLIQKLSVFKNNSSLLVSVIIGLVGVLVFIPTQLMSSKLKEQIRSESIARGNSVRRLKESAVSSEQWKNEKKRQQKYQSDANEIALLAKHSTQRELLSYRIFPEPKDTSTLIFEEFGQQFCKVIDELIARANARDCPTDAELERGLQRSSGPSRLGPRRPSRLPRTLSRRSYYGRRNEVETTIVEEICRQKAESASVYAHPADLSGYEFWKEYNYTGADEATKDCWYYQLAYWVIEDVIDTISACNAGYDNVLTSPVKRLLGVNFAVSKRRRYSSRPPRTRRYIGVRRRETVSDKPSYVLSLYEGLTETCTGRICNDDIDVIHFNVVVVVSTKAISPFMQQLCSAKQHKFMGWQDKDDPAQPFKHNQITILESKIKSIDREDQTHSLYRYGDDAVVEMDLICEYIFNKKGYDEIKPESIKNALKREGETIMRR